MKPRHLTASLAIALCAVALPVAADDHAARHAAVMRVLDQYLDALNALDLEGHVATLHFPHFRLAAEGNLVVWKTPDDAMPLLKLPPDERAAGLRKALHPDWHRSEWTRRDIVQDGPDKVHVATRFVRLREDRSEIIAFDSLYVLTLEDGRWGIRGRSSFAP